jgi:hypothetical protein
MKKQTNPNIKAHLLRGAFYMVLLSAVCVIPFALGQRTSCGFDAGTRLRISPICREISAILSPVNLAENMKTDSTRTTV